MTEPHGQEAINMHTRWGLQKVKHPRARGRRLKTISVRSFILTHPKEPRDRTAFIDNPASSYILMYPFPHAYYSSIKIKF